MSQKADYLQLEESDDSTSVRDRLAFTRGKRVLLIWPEHGTVLTRKLDLVLIQREAMRRAVRLALVTHDPQVMKHAEELNISAFETIGASERKRWKRGRSKVFVDRLDKPADEPEPETLKPVASRLRNEDEDREPKKGRGLLRAGILLALLAVGLALVALLMPSATVAIAPAQDTIPVSATVIADAGLNDVDIATGAVPAVIMRVEVEDSGTLSTSGAQAVSDVPATGSVVFINQTGQQIEIPADTTVGTSAGTPILFRTLEAAVAPAQVGGQIEVPVEALPGSAGSIGNVEAGLINTIIGPLSEILTVRNLSATFGGESRTVQVVSQEDYDRLLATLRQQLQARAYVAMEQQMTPSQTILLETIRLSEERDDWKTWSADIGDIADTLTLTMRARVEATVIDEGLAQQVALSRLSAQIPPGRALAPESVTYQCCSVQEIFADGRVAFTVTGQGLATARINTGLLQERLAGRTTEEARRYLLSEVDLAGESMPEIEIVPEWFPRLPFLGMRIGVQLADAGA